MRAQSAYVKVQVSCWPLDFLISEADLAQEHAAFSRTIILSLTEFSLKSLEVENGQKTKEFDLAVWKKTRNVKKTLSFIRKDSGGVQKPLVA